MQIESKITLNNHRSLNIKLVTGESINQTIIEKTTKVYAVVLIKNKLLVVYNSKMDMWGFPGGTIEKYESLEQALERELIEEANIKVISSKILGYSCIENNHNEYQLFYYVEAEKLGEFQVDPDVSITENKYINPCDWNTYLKWGKVGAYVINQSQLLNNSNHKLELSK